MQPDHRQSTARGVLFAMVFPSVITYLYFVALADRARWLQQSAYLVGKTLQFAFPLAWVWLYHRPALRLKRPAASGAGLAVAFGLVVALAIVLLYPVILLPSGAMQRAGPAITAKVRAFGVHSSLAYLALGLFYSVIHAGLEEYYWRWFVFGQLRRLVAVRAALLVSSLGFMAHHVIVLGTYLGWNSLWTVCGSLGVAIGGAFWAWLYERTGNLYASWLSHLLVDAGIFAVGYLIVRSSW